MCQKGVHDWSVYVKGEECVCGNINGVGVPYSGRYWVLKGQQPSLHLQLSSLHLLQMQQQELQGGGITVGEV